MPSKVFGAQSQRFDGIVNVIGQAQPPVWLCIDPDSNILSDIRAASPNTATLVRIYTGAPSVDDKGQHPDPEAYGREYATRVYSAVKQPGSMDYLLSENEPNDHYNNLTEFIKRLDAFLVGFSQRAKELGFRPLGPNFSTGYPEVFVPGTDYELWPNAWQGLTSGLRALRDANGALSLHEYDAPDLFRLWSDSKQRGFLVGRHKAIYECLPADLQTLLLYLTEFGIDWLTQGVQGGFWHNRNEDAPTWMIGQMREAWKRIYSTTPQLRGIACFIWGSNNPALWEEYDFKRTDTSAQAFTNFFAEGLPGAVAVMPPAFAFDAYPLLQAYPISQGFGENPAVYQPLGFPGHEGIDLACPVGTPIRAVAAGTVVEAKNLGNYGLRVIVKHANGWQTIYAHLLEAAPVGLKTVAGGYVGRSGASGNVTGPHLHITLRCTGFTYTDAHGAWPWNVFDPTARLAAVTPPANGGHMTIQQDRITRAWNSIGVPYNPDAAFPKQALALALGRPVGKEYTNMQGMSGQGFERAFLESPAGDVLSAKAYDWTTGEPYVAPGPPVIVPPGSQPKRLSTSTLPPYVFPDGTKVDLGMSVISYQQQPGEQFWGLVAVGAYKLNVGTQIVLTARDAAGAKFDVPMTHAWDAARQKSETVLTDGDGKRTVVLGSGSDYTPPTPPPDRIYVSKGDGQDGSTWPTPAGDIWVTGQPGGHFEGAATFLLMTG